MRKQFLAMCVLSVLTVSTSFANDGDVKDAKRGIKKYELDKACGIEANVGDSQPGGIFFFSRDNDIAVKGFGTHGYIWMTDCASETVKDPLDKKKKSTNISCRGIYETEQSPEGKVCLVDKLSLRGLGDKRPVGMISELTLSQERLEGVPLFQACTLDYIQKHKGKVVSAVATQQCSGQ